MQKILTAMAFAFVVCLMSASSATTARATYCHTFTADSGNNTIVFGSHVEYVGAKDPFYWETGEIDICWRDSSNVLRYVATNCDAGDADDLYVIAGAGNDTVGPAQTDDHNCGTGIMIWSYDESILPQSLTADMGTGVDTVYGTEHGGDSLASNTASQSADTASGQELLCAYGGDWDYILADNDDSSSMEERMDGGTGANDVCDGDLWSGGGGSTYDDYAAGCNSAIKAAYQMFGVGCGSASPDIWP